jgi:hypothetical protein
LASAFKLYRPEARCNNSIKADCGHKNAAFFPAKKKNCKIIFLALSHQIVLPALVKLPKFLLHVFKGNLHFSDPGNQRQKMVAVAQR